MMTLAKRQPDAIYYSPFGRVWYFGAADPANLPVGAWYGAAYEATGLYIRFAVVERHVPGKPHLSGRFVQEVSKREMSADELDALRSWG